MLIDRMAGRRPIARARQGLLAAFLVLAVAACGTATASSTPSPTAAPTDTPAATLAPTDTPTPPPTVAPTDTPAPTPPPGPLCQASELVAAVALWSSPAAGTQGDFFAGSRTSTAGGRLCYFHGTAEAQLVAGGVVIADSGLTSAHAIASDPYLALPPGGRMYASVVWSNWCPKGPSQPVAIAFVLPGGLGRVVAATGGGPGSAAPVPPCVNAANPTALTSITWHL